MSDEKPRLGPFLRHYGREEKKSLRERLTEVALIIGAVVGFLIVLAGVMWSFFRFPIATFIGLVVVWGVGFLVLRVKRQRAKAQERALRDAQLRDRDR